MGPQRADNTAQAQGSPKVLGMRGQKACTGQPQGHWDRNTAQCGRAHGRRALWIPMGEKLVLPHLGYPRAEPFSSLGMPILPALIQLQDM